MHPSGNNLGLDTINEEQKSSTNGTFMKDLTVPKGRLALKNAGGSGIVTGGI